MTSGHFFLGLLISSDNFCPIFPTNYVLQRTISAHFFHGLCIWKVLLPFFHGLNEFWNMTSAQFFHGLWILEDDFCRIVHGLWMLEEELCSIFHSLWVLKDKICTIFSRILNFGGLLMSIFFLNYQFLRLLSNFFHQLSISKGNF